jgi:hypothetical protein
LDLSENDVSHTKQRIIAVLLILFSGAMIYYGWYRLWNEGVYSLKMAAFAPLGVVGGIFLLIFPSLGGKPNTTKEKLIVMAVFAVGIVAGLINWFLMDPGFFGVDLAR